jgi:hypothetical protein
MTSCNVGIESAEYLQSSAQANQASLRAAFDRDAETKIALVACSKRGVLT